MCEDAGNERARLLREAVTVAVEAVATTLPKREVHMAAVARVLGPRLRRQRGDEALPNRHRANRLPNEQLLVRRLERGRMPGRDLLLAVPELGVVLLERDRLRVKRRCQVIGVVLRNRRRDGREAEPGVDRHVGAIDLRSQRELVLERRPEDEPALGETGLHPLQERALADGRRVAAEHHVIRERRAGVRRVRQHAEGVEIGDEPDLADRAHPGDRLELVERVHRLHRDGEPDARVQPSLETVPGRRLRADRAVVPAPEEADEAETRLVRALRDLLRRHAGEIVGVGCSRRCMNSLIA